MTCIYFFSAGIAVGHVYYFLEDVFPQQRGGFRILKTPRFLYVPNSLSYIFQPYIINYGMCMGCDISKRHYCKVVIIFSVTSKHGMGLT